MVELIVTQGRKVTRVLGVGGKWEILIKGINFVIR